MSTGIGSGIVSGGLVGAVVMSILSLYAPLPQDRIDAAPKLKVETPEPDAVSPEDTSAAPQVDTAPVVTASTDLDVPTAEMTTPQQGVSAATNSDSPAANIVSSDAQVAQLTPQAPAVKPDGGDEIVIASADPAPTAATQVETGVQAPTIDISPNVEDSSDISAQTIQPSRLPLPTVTGTEKAVDSTGLEQPRTSGLPSVSGAQEAPLEVAAANRPITLPQVNSGVVVNRLPTIGGTSTSAAPAPTEAEAVAIDPADLGALRAFGTKVEGAEGKSLFGIILIDSGADGIPRQDLMKLSLPVTIAIDPTAPDAARIMADYRQAGIEVIAIANELPTASSPSDVAVAVGAYFNILDQAVGLMDPLDARIQSNRTLLQPVLGAIRKSGHGLVTYDRGLNTAQQAAQREKIPAATVFRVLDANLEEGPKIKRYLDRAAFNANRDGSVVVVGRSYAETVKAIMEWVLEKKESGVAIVPVSAVMLAGEAS